MFQRQQERANRDLERQRAEIDATLEVKVGRLGAGNLWVDHACTAFNSTEVLVRARELPGVVPAYYSKTSL